VSSAGAQPLAAPTDRASLLQRRKSEGQAVGLGLSFVSKSQREVQEKVRARKQSDSALLDDGDGDASPCAGADSAEAAMGMGSPTKPTMPAAPAPQKPKPKSEETPSLPKGRLRCPTGSRYATPRESRDDKFARKYRFDGKYTVRFKLHTVNQGKPTTIFANAPQPKAASQSSTDGKGGRPPTPLVAGNGPNTLPNGPASALAASMLAFRSLRLEHTPAAAAAGSDQNWYVPCKSTHGVSSQSSIVVHHPCTALCPLILQVVCA
jgi:hypothetical protein